MKFIGIRKREEGCFIHRYNLLYQTEQGRNKTYEIISRKRNLTSLEQLQAQDPTAVVIIAYDEQGRILINREFRMAVGEWVYNFPAGLIEPGETPEEAARRELWEETGLHLNEITDMIGKSYSAVSFSEESNFCIVGTASGRFRPSTSDEEEIVPGWYTKEEVKELLLSSPFAARTQAWCYVWSHS